jgi:hypothetical protein
MSSLRFIFMCMCTLLWGSVFEAGCIPFFADYGIGYENFRGIPEGDWEGNAGALISANFAVKPACDPLIGHAIQAGVSYGVYDWDGRGSVGGSVQHQIFVTAGISRETSCPSGLNYGLVYDWLWTKNYGVFALDPIIDQLRFQAGYTVGGCNEFGLWGTLDLRTSEHAFFFIPIRYRAISQINAFWRHTFNNCAETIVWAGAPYKKGLMFSTGRAGEFIIGGAFRAPLTSRLAVEGRAVYMNPNAPSGFFGPKNYVANVCLELKYAFGVGTDVKRPYMPLANSGNFLVDTNLNF